MPTIGQDEALLMTLETNMVVAKNSADYFVKLLGQLIERRRKGVDGDRKADERLRVNCNAAVDKLREIELLYDQALKNAGLPEERRG